MKRKIRVLPTRMWAVMGPIIICVWLAAVNYSNNLVYFVLYLLVSLVLVSFYYTRKNLISLQVDQIRIRPAFVGSDVIFDIDLRNQGSLPCYSLSVFCLTQGSAAPQQLLVRDSAVNCLDAYSGSEIQGSIQAKKRGLYRLIQLEVQSSYPIGLFITTVRITLDMPFYLYPEPLGKPRLPETNSVSETDAAPNPSLPGDDFFGLRSYQPGEPLRHVAWKAYARGRPLMVKQFVGGGGPQLLLDYDAIPGLSPEARLSQMTLWAIKADEAHLPFGVRVSANAIPAASGPVHLQKVLQALSVA